MDIYNFINSKDIRQHCRRIEYQFNAIEAAFLIWQSQRHSIAEKYAAWQEIIDTMPDMKVGARRNGPSVDMILHELLQQYMKISDKLFRAFYQDDPGTVYTYEILYDNGETIEGGRFCATFQACQQALKRDFDAEEEQRLSEVMIKKLWLRTSEYPDGGALNARFFPDAKSAFAIKADYWMILSAEEVDIYGAFDAMWFQIPTPFQKGDIVSSCTRHRPFVLEYLCTEMDSKDIERFKREADSSDMTADGYFLNEGRLYHTCVHDYLSLEYYKPNSGRERILTAVSHYLKGEISLTLLLDAYDIIFREEELAQLRQGLSYTEEGLRLAGLL